MAFPDIHKFPASTLNAYERWMGASIVGLLKLFANRVPDTESHASVAELAANPSRWSAGHAVFDEIRRRFLAANDRGDQMKSGQYSFEESCCQAMYNATEPPDAFDPSSAFFVVARALVLAPLFGVSLDSVAEVFTANA